MRPPGHHAERNRVMGFCYLNNIAIAVAWALHSSPDIRRVANQIFVPANRTVGIMETSAPAAANQGGAQ